MLHIYALYGDMQALFLHTYMDEFIFKMLNDTHVCEKFASRSLLCIRKYGLMIEISASAHNHMM